jgi:ubiquinol-cytochrome c reductase cytochrome c1 subunit
MTKPMNKLLIAATAAAAISVSVPSFASEAPKAPAQDWSFSGIFGTFDRGALQRGLQVYREVCISCHSLHMIAFRNLAALGLGPDEIQAIAEQYEVQDGPDDEGEMFMRPAKAADYFVPPFPNEQAARAANNGALPPDLSLIVKARKDGANYIYGLLTGYEEEPSQEFLEKYKETHEGAEFQMMEGMHFNKYFPGFQIAMVPPLAEGSVDYADGTEATLDQEAHDVVTFLAWAAQPELEARKRMGVKVLLFLIVLTAMLYAVKRKIWSDVH